MNLPKINTDNVLEISVRLRNQEDLEVFARLIGMPRLAAKSRRHVKNIVWPPASDKDGTLL